MLPVTYRKSALGLLFLLVIMALGLGFLWSFMWQTQSSRISDQTRSISRTGLGVIYVPVTAKTASYYGLDIDFGALVTQVIPESPADIAGLQQGDVIMTFNGIVLREGVSLVRLLIECTVGHGVSPHTVNIHFLRAGCPHSINLFHGASSDN